MKKKQTKLDAKILKIVKQIAKDNKVSREEASLRFHNYLSRREELISSLTKQIHMFQVDMLYSIKSFIEQNPEFEFDEEGKLVQSAEIIAQVNKSLSKELSANN